MKLCMGCMEQYSEKFDICPHCGYEENSLPEEAFHLIPGTVIGERYIVGKVLGFGGFGVTYIGYDKELEKKVAIKEYLPSEFSTRTLHQTKVTVYGGDKTEQFGLGMAKFVDEARKLARFGEDTEIVNVYDTFMENDTAYIIMEYLEGENLKELLERKGTLTLEEAENIMLPIYRSLKVVHDAGIIHRDIAPDNIFITRTGKVKLLDFGAARYASATHSRSLTVIYKPGYAPEEQYQSRGEQGPWTDVYALSATFYKCLTGVTPDTSLERKVKDTLKEPSKLGVDIPRNKETALMNALNIRVEARTKSTEDFLGEWESKSEVARIVDKIRAIDVGKLSKKAKMGIVAGIGALAAGIALVIGLSGVGRIKDSIEVAQGSVRVPSVVNEYFDNAVTMTEASGIHMVQEDTKYDATIEKGKILSQNVEAGQLMELSNRLMVVVSGGIRQVFMPEVAGSTKEVAVQTLTTEGFTYRIVDEYSSAAVGNVIRTSYEPGTQCDEGTEVILYVSKGIDPATIVIPEDKPVEYVVRDYSGMTVTEVMEELREYGIYLDYSEQMGSETVAKDCIISQKTAVGTTLTTGDTVKVVMSTGVTMINIGDIIGWKYTERELELEIAGLVLEKGDEVYDNNRAAGLILSVKTADGQTVTDGMRVKKGTKLICTVSKGPKPVDTPTPVPKATKTPKPTATPEPTSTPKITEGPTPIPHTHSWQSSTCNDPERCATCGATRGTALGHSWQAATCTSAKKCSRCGQVQGTSLGHNWQAATCTTPKKCTRCLTTDGAALGHSWNKETCTEAKYCKVCGHSEGTALGHSWKDATCTTPKTCTECGKTEGSATGHAWVAATCTTPKTCSVCKATEGSAAGHNWKAATCTVPKTCSVCKATEGNAIGHNWQAATCTAPKTCSVCKATEGNATGHKWQAATCTAPKTCSVCKATEGSATGHSWQNATCTTPKTCSVCKATEGSATGHSWKEATCTALKTCSVCKVTEGSLADHKYDSTTDLYCNVCNHERGYWTEWVDGGKDVISATSTRQVETRTVSVPVTQYRYKRCLWYSSSTGELSSSRLPPNGYTLGTVKKGSKTYKWDYTPWITTKLEAMYNSSWGIDYYRYNETTYYTEETNTVYNDEIHYFYRDVKYY